jgi:hypothetical protein
MPRGFCQVRDNRPSFRLAHIAAFTTLVFPGRTAHCGMVEGMPGRDGVTGS